MSRLWNNSGQILPMPPRSTAKAVQAQRDELLRIIREHPEGITRAQLEVAYQDRRGEKLNYRTALRRLDEMVNAGSVVPDGAGHGRAYRSTVSDEALAPMPTLEAPDVTAPTGATVTSAVMTDDDASYPPLSYAGEEVRVLVRRPRSKRTPCTYDGTFLGAYLPASPAASKGTSTPCWTPRNC